MKRKREWKANGLYVEVYSELNTAEAHQKAESCFSDAIKIYSAEREKGMQQCGTYLYSH